MVGALVVVAIAASALAIWALRPGPITIAVANSFTGPQQIAGSESLIATRLAVDEANREGGIGGHRIELVTFDDRSDPATARANAAAIVAGPAVAVLGHFFSNASLAASPIYRAARLPAVTGTSLADELTSGNPYYFRTQATISAEARSIGEYIREVWRPRGVSLIYSNDANGRGFLRGFLVGHGPGAFRKWAFAAGRAERKRSLEGVVRAAAAENGQDVIVVGTGADSLPDVVKAIRRRGLSGRLIAAANTGNVQLTQAFAGEPEETTRPGFFTHDLYVAAPVFFDSAGASGTAYGDAYANASGRKPSWIGAGAYDAANLLIAALRQADLRLTEPAKTADRERVRRALAAIDSPATAVPGVAGPLFFDARRNVVRSIRVGYLQNGRFVTAPEQLVLVEHPASLDLPAEIRLGHVVRIGDRDFWRQRIVYTGIDIIKLSHIDLRQGLFTADFYLWMRYGGNDDAPTQVEFPGSADKSTPLVNKDAFDPEHPLETGTESGLNYRLFRVRGNFGSEYDLRDYPFDTQQLIIRFQNARQRRELIAYVIDRAGLKLVEDGAIQDTQPYHDLQLWRFGGLRYYVDSLGSPSTLGKPENFATPVRVEHAVFSAAIVMHRNYWVFIVKTLTPVLLLVMVVFSTLFFPQSLLKEQVTLPVTGILTSAVLLISMNNQLPDIGYTVAIEYVFYVFFGLCLLAIVSAFQGERLAVAGKKHAAILLNRWVKGVYVTAVIATIVLFWLHYH